MSEVPLYAVPTSQHSQPESTSQDDLLLFNSERSRQAGREIHVHTTASLPPFTPAPLPPCMAGWRQRARFTPSNPTPQRPGADIARWKQRVPRKSRPGETRKARGGQRLLSLDAARDEGGNIFALLSL